MEITMTLHNKRKSLYVTKSLSETGFQVSGNMFTSIFTDCDKNWN